MQDLAVTRKTRSMATAAESLTKRTLSMPMHAKTMKTMPLCMTAAMKNQFVKHADKRSADFVTVSQNPTETRESDLIFQRNGPSLIHWDNAPLYFFCTNISSDSYKITQKERKVYAC
jgi:hypothetical protein